jgi:type I restriction enzyme, S subunit
MAQAFFSSEFPDFLMPPDGGIPLSIVLNLANGFAFKSGTYSESGPYKVITIKNVQDGLIDSDGANCVNELPARISPLCILNPGDVLLSLTGNVGRVGIVIEDDLLLNQRVAKLDPVNPELLPFWYFAFRSYAMKDHMINIAKVTAQQNLSPVETLKTHIDFDGIEARRFATAFEPVFAQIIALRQESAHLADLRDSLLPRLMSGEISVAGLGS